MIATDDVGSWRQLNILVHFPELRPPYFVLTLEVVHMKSLNIVTSLESIHYLRCPGGTAAGQECRLHDLIHDVLDGRIGLSHDDKQSSG